MIDIHCHILPGIDDGPSALEAALALAKACSDDGIDRIIATPHVFPGRFENWRTSIVAEVSHFAGVLEAGNFALQIGWAGEVRLTPEALDLLIRDELPFLGVVDGYRTMLLEMPDGQIPLGAMHFIKQLLRQQIRPVIVHPERNRAVISRTDRLEPFIDEHCFVQVTAGSLIGQFGAKAQACAHELLERGWVHAVASDAHNLAGRRPRMSEARDWLVRHHGETVADQLTRRGPAMLSAGNESVNIR